MSTLQVPRLFGPQSSAQKSPVEAEAAKPLAEGHVQAFLNNLIGIGGIAITLAVIVSGIYVSCRFLI